MDGAAVEDIAATVAGRVLRNALLERKARDRDIQPPVRIQGLIESRQSGHLKKSLIQIRISILHERTVTA